MSTLNLELPLLLKNAKAPPNRKRRLSAKILRRRFEIVRIWNSPYCQLLNYSHFAKILKVSSNTINRDCEFLAKYKLLLPLRTDEIPYTPTESAQQYLERFLAVHGLEL
jgi:CRISPR/Cas system-associated endoribonuclease Cas2